MFRRRKLWESCVACFPVDTDNGQICPLTYRLSNESAQDTVLWFIMVYFRPLIRFKWQKKKSYLTQIFLHKDFALITYIIRIITCLLQQRAKQGNTATLEGTWDFGARKSPYWDVAALQISPPHPLQKKIIALNIPTNNLCFLSRFNYSFLIRCLILTSSCLFRLALLWKCIRYWSAKGDSNQSNNVCKVTAKS